MAEAVAWLSQPGLVRSAARRCGCKVFWEREHAMATLDSTRPYCRCTGVRRSSARSPLGSTLPERIALPDECRSSARHVAYCKACGRDVPMPRR